MVKKPKISAAKILIKTPEAIFKKAIDLTST